MGEWEEIRKEGTRTYRMIPQEESEADSCYLHMLAENRIPGLLPLERREWNDVRAYAYDISSKVSLKTYCETRKVRSEQLLRLVKDLENALQTAQMYMLEPDYFLLDEDMVFLEAESGAAFFICTPSAKAPWREQFAGVLRFLLEKIDYREEAGVRMAYELYHLCCEEHVTAEALRECAERSLREPMEEEDEESRQEEEEIVAGERGFEDGSRQDREKSWEESAFPRRKRLSGTVSHEWPAKAGKIAAQYLLPAAAAVLFWYIWFGR